MTPPLKVMIGIPTARLEPRPWLEEPLFRLYAYSCKAGFDVKIPVAMPGCFVEKNRNALLQLAEEWEQDAILMIDSDTIPPEDTIEKLAALEVPVSSGLYFQRQPPFQPQAYRLVEVEGVLRYRAIIPIPDTPFPVNVVGGGCLFIRREAWVALSPRPFRFIYEDGRSESEDFYFSRRVREELCSVIVHPGVECGHVNWLPIGRVHFEQNWTDIWHRASSHAGNKPSDIAVYSPGQVEVSY